MEVAGFRANHEEYYNILNPPSYDNHVNSMREVTGEML